MFLLDLELFIPETNLESAYHSPQTALRHILWFCYHIDLVLLWFQERVDFDANPDKLPQGYVL